MNGSQATNQPKAITKRFSCWFRDLLDRRAALREFNAIETGELERIARDLCMSPSELRALAAQGPDAAKLLRERMSLLGISEHEAESAGVLRDLQRLCSVCGEKGRCSRDLADNDRSGRWQSYCPNAPTMQELLNANSRSGKPVRKH